MSESPFQIKVPGMDEARIKEQIDSILNKFHFTDTEKRMVEELDFMPVSPAQEVGFNPPLTCELYERQVGMPDFSSRKYRHLFGPAKWLIKKIYYHLNLFFERSSRNKVQAFYHIVHELIYLRHRLKILETSKKPTAPIRSKPEHLILEPSYARGLLDRIFDSLIEEKANSILILDDNSGMFIQRALKSGLQNIESNSLNPELFPSFANIPGLILHHSHCDLLLIKNNTIKYSHCIVSNLGNFSGDINDLPIKLTATLNVNAMVFLVYQNTCNHSGFYINNKYRIDQNELRQSFLDKGFELVETVIPDYLDKDSFLMILKSP